MSGEATILHADADAFFAAVEQRDDPRLRGRPVIVGGGVVMAASYEARAYGVRGAMGGARARRLCPQAVVVTPRFSAYVEASKQLFSVFEQTAPAVEGLSLEEAFLDVAGLLRISGTPREIAARLRREVRSRVGLPITVGVARTKVLAKMASRAAKPDGLLVVEPERERAFLDPLAVEHLWGVGPRTAEKLHRQGIATVGELAQLTEEAVVSIVGRAAGRHLSAVAANRDRHRVRAGRSRRSIGAQHALGRTPRSPEAVDAVLVGLVDRTTRRLRAAGRLCRTVVVRLRFGDYSRATRSRTLAQPTSSTENVLRAARGLLAAARPIIDARGLTLVGVALTELGGEGAGIQLELPLDRSWSRALDAAVDELRERFGSSAITRAVLVGGERQEEAPDNPGQLGGSGRVESWPTGRR